MSRFTRMRDSRLARPVRAVLLIGCLALAWVCVGAATGAGAGGPGGADVAGAGRGGSAAGGAARAGGSDGGAAGEGQPVDAGGGGGHGGRAVLAPRRRG